MIIEGDALAVLSSMPEASVHSAVTSPPYWRMRDYGVEGQYGLEPTIDGYIERQVIVFRALKRVLRQDGTLWLVVGDRYSSSNIPHPEKQLLGLPWRLALALQADSWWLRSDSIWHKPNAKPESVKDRPGLAHEYVFLFAASESYYYERTNRRDLRDGHRAADAKRKPAHAR